MPSAPKNLQVTFRTPEDAEVRWLPPLSSVRVDHYKVAIGCVPAACPPLSMLFPRCL